MKQESNSYPIRVLHVVTYMGRGGLETMLMNYFRHIDRNKVQFDFLVHRSFKADYDEEILALGGKIFRLPNLNPFNSTYIQNLDSFFAENKEYSIVHSHLDCMAGIPLKYAEKYGVPIRIAHAHNSNQTKDIKYILKLVYKNNIQKYANYLYACGEEAGLWMYRTDNFKILHNAIDSKSYIFDEKKRDKIRGELGLSKDTLVIGHVGRFSPQKNHEYLIKIFYELQKKYNNAILLLVGDGDLKEKIRKQSESLGITNKVIFTGIRSDVENILQAMDVFVFPSKYEGLPVSIIEAQAAGLPCIISNQVPIGCKITNNVYQITLNEDVKEWVNCILRNIGNKRKNRYKEICTAGYDIKENAKKLEGTYLSMLQEGENFV